jgi:bifunctional NMN adenylyltransferase/nudix hydrolase
MSSLKTVNESAEVGAIVARFQVPELHEEHKALIQRVIDTHPRVFVILGLAADACKCTYNNPLDYPTRKAMVEKEFPTVEVLYIKDIGNDVLWSKELDRIINSQIGPNQNVLLYGGRDSFIPHYCGKFPTQELVPSKFISGKEIRKNIGIKSKATPQFREGVIWAVENTWPSSLPTVDIAILDRNKALVLLCRKPNQDKLRFVGGFAHPDSECYEDDAKREVSEETHLEVGNIQYIGSARIRDWRFEGERNKIKTSFFAADYTFGSPQADDDIAEVEWASWASLNEGMFIEEHKVLCRMLCKFLAEKVIGKA